MLAAYDPHAPKRAQPLRDIGTGSGRDPEEKKREQWLAENSKAIDAYNEYVEAQGVFSDELRSF